MTASGLDVHVNRHIWTLACVDVMTDSERGIDSLFNVFEHYSVTARVNSEETEDEVEATIGHFPMAFKLLSCWNHIPRAGDARLDEEAEHLMTVGVKGPNGIVQQIPFTENNYNVKISPISRLVSLNVTNPPYLGRGLYWFFVNFTYAGEEKETHGVPIYLGVEFEHVDSNNGDKN